MSGQLLDYVESLGLALQGIAPVTGTETLPVADAGERVLAEPVVADRDFPPFNRAQMDGYALRAADFTPGHAWPVVATVPAGAPGAVAVPGGSCVAIATGAPLPADVDTVIQHELSDRADPVRFTTDSVTPGQAVHPRGADARAGVTIVGPGITLNAQHLGLAAAVGLEQVMVRRRPRAVILTSGDEVVGPGSPVLPHQIRNSNGPMLAELLRRMGTQVTRATHLVDDRQVTIDGVGDALADADVVVTVGGVSAGDRDHFPAAFEAHGVTTSLRGAAIQPGKPILVGRGGDRVVVALPGNPVSVLACACLFLWPVTRVLRGVEADLPWRPVTAREPVRPNPRRRAFRPAIDHGDGTVTVPGWAGSGDLSHTTPTSGLAELPVSEKEVAAGEALRFLPWP